MSVQKGSSIDVFPDELLHIVLEFLIISDFHWCPRWTPLLPNRFSCVVRVSKRFHRVATPFLFHTIDLRTCAQADHLYNVLGKNKSCAGWVRRLRIDEDAYKIPMRYILSQLSLNITHIIISTRLLSHTKGIPSLYMGLRDIQPSHLILNDKGVSLNSRIVREIMEYLIQLLNRSPWSQSLISVTIPSYISQLSPQADALGEALCNLTRLRTVYITGLRNFDFDIFVPIESCEKKVQFVASVLEHEEFPDISWNGLIFQ